MSESALIWPDSCGRAGRAKWGAVITPGSRLVLVFAVGQRVGILASECMLFLLQSSGLLFCFVFKLLNFKLWSFNDFVCCLMERVCAGFSHPGCRGEWEVSVACCLSAGLLCLLFPHRHWLSCRLWRCLGQWVTSLCSAASLLLAAVCRLFSGASN